MKKTITTSYFLALVLAAFCQVQVGTLTDQFNGSGGVKLGPDGFLYVGDYGSSLPNPNGTTVWRINSATGEREIFASGMSGASGNDFDSQGNFYQSNIGFGSVRKITPAGNISTFSTGFNVPIGIVIDNGGNLYVANHANNIIHKILPNGTSSIFASGSPLNCPNGLTIDKNGNIYTSNFSDNRVIKMKPDGTKSILATLDGNSNGHLVYSEIHDALFVTSHGSHSIFHVTLDGMVTKIAGTGARGNKDGDALTEATFSRPNGIAISPDGDTLWVNSSIPVTDAGFPLNPSVIRMITGLNGLLSPTKELAPGNIPVKVLPNPSAGIFKIELPAEKVEHYSVFDINGKYMDGGQVNAGSKILELDIKGYIPGTYFIKMKNGGKLYVGKLLKK